MIYKRLIPAVMILICAGCAKSGQTPVAEHFDNSKELNRYLKKGIEYYKSNKPIEARQEFVKFFAALGVECRIEFEDITNEAAYKEQIVQEYIKRIEPVLIQKTTNKQTQLMKGIALYEAGDYKNALEYFVQVLVLDNRNQDALKYVEMANREMVRVEEEQRKQKLLEEQELAKKMITLYYSKAKKYYRKGLFLEAKSELDKVISIDPDYMKTAEYYAKIDNELLKAAKKHYQDALYLYSSGDEEKAIELWEKAIILAPAYKEAQKALERAKARLDK